MNEIYQKKQACGKAWASSHVGFSNSDIIGLTVKFFAKLSGWEIDIENSQVFGPYGQNKVLLC